MQKVIWALGELGLVYEHVPLGGAFGGLDDPAYRALNPNGRVPTLRDGDLVIWESHAIVRYLAGAYGQGSLWPSDPRQRAISDQWTDWTATTFQTAWLRVFELWVRTPAAQRQPERIAAARAHADRLYLMLNDCLASRDFLGGDRPSFADIVAGVSLFRWMTMDIERTPMPHVEAWYRRLEARPAFGQAVCVSYADMVGVPPPV